MHRFRPKFTTLFCLAIMAAAPAVHGTEPLWPLDLSTRYLTSNFMEHRSGRFHAGLDLKTNSRSGFPVRAVEDGWISRIRNSAGGYGKALYLRGASGRTYVYAHLSRIGDRWRSQVERTQARRGRYDVTLHFPAGKYEVRRGEVLALSGQSGTGGPHLHFEVRDTDNRPVDPQGWGFAVPDTIAPRILKVRVIPAAPGARIDGDLTARSVAGDPLTGELPRLDVYGPVAFTARVLEIADVMGHRLEPYRLSVTLDDSLVYEARNESYDFSSQYLMRLEWLEQPGPRERWLYRREGNVLPGRTGGPWCLDPTVLTTGRHTVVLRVADRAGNMSEVTWPLIVAAEQDADPPRHRPGWERDPLGVEDPARPGRRLTPFLVLEGETARPCEPVEGFLAGGTLAAAPDSLTVQEVRAAERGQGLRDLGWVARVVSPDWTARNGTPLPCGAGLPDTLPPASGIYVQNGRGEWSLAGRPRRLGEAWVFDAHGPGRYAFFADANAPYLGPGPDEGLVGLNGAGVVPEVTPPIWETVAIRLEDRGAGVDVSSIAVTLDGRPLIVEPDLPRDRILVEFPDDTVPGSHRLMVSATDQAGHVTERAYDLVLIDGR